MDTARSVNPVTFMSNMLYACSILYKTKLPFVVVMNKVSYSWLSFWLFICIYVVYNYVLGTGESYGPTAQHTQDSPICFIQLSYAHK